MLSIVTGTLDRKHCLPRLIENTVDSDDRLELVLVDGGSTDGTLEYVKERRHPRIKLIEIGERSSYPHFMNIGVRNAKYDFICQWNDDVILIEPWSTVFDILNDSDVLLFSWQYGVPGENLPFSWNLLYENGVDISLVDPSCGNQIVMNYGTYRKKIFKEIGLYNPKYKYYYADGDMSFRAWSFGYKVIQCRDIHVLSILQEMSNKRAIGYPNEIENYREHLRMYRNRIIPEYIERL